MASESTTPEPSGPPASREAGAPARHRLIAICCAAFVVAMVGAAYAAVPLYQMFCQITGFGGATRVATAAPDQALDRTIEVRFDANVAPGLAWTFRPDVPSMRVKIGETVLAHYRVTSRADGPTTAAATYNVAPAQSGPYFGKMQCFCFTDQTLQPGETMDMPVVFFVDPALAEDAEMAGLKTITLSYTFFQKAAPVAAGKPAEATPAKAPL